MRLLALLFSVLASPSLAQEPPQIDPAAQITMTAAQLQALMVAERAQERAAVAVDVARVSYDMVLKQAKKAGTGAKPGP